MPDEEPTPKKESPSLLQPRELARELGPLRSSIAELRDRVFNDLAEAKDGRSRLVALWDATHRLLERHLVDPAGATALLPPRQMLGVVAGSYSQHVASARTYAAGMLEALDALPIESAEAHEASKRSTPPSSSNKPKRKLSKHEQTLDEHGWVRKQGLQLPAGGQADLHVVVHRDNPKKIAVAKFAKGPRGKPRLRKEIDTLLKLEELEVRAPRVVVHWGDWYVMDFHPGGTLARPKLDLPGTPAALALFIRELVADLAKAHEAGIIHRDIKPANVLIQDRGGVAPLLADWGIAYQYEDEQDRLTQLGERVGPRDYIAPELEDGGEPTPASDMYSLGKLLWWLFDRLGGSADRPPSRENFRVPSQNLIGRTGEPQMEFVNELLDRLITRTPSERLTANELQQELGELESLFRSGFQPLGTDMRCRFCGRGRYRRVVDNGSGHNFGVRDVGMARWRVLVCSRCGHSQVFRLDLASHPDW